MLYLFYILLSVDFDVLFPFFPAGKPLGTLTAGEPAGALPRAGKPLGALPRAGKPPGALLPPVIAGAA